jgi:hypothetical protein
MGGGGGGGKEELAWLLVLRNYTKSNVTMSDVTRCQVPSLGTFL